MMCRPESASAAGFLDAEGEREEGGGADGGAPAETCSRKILRQTMRKIADGEDCETPATIDDPAISGEIGEGLRAAGVG